MDELAAPDDSYPTFVRTAEITTVRLRPDGSYDLQMNENFRAKFSDGLEFHRTSFEVWGEREERREVASEPPETDGGYEPATTEDASP